MPCGKQGCYYGQYQAIRPHLCHILFLPVCGLWSMTAGMAMVGGAHRSTTTMHAPSVGAALWTARRDRGERDDTPMTAEGTPTRGTPATLLRCAAAIWTLLACNNSDTSSRQRERTLRRASGSSRSAPSLVNSNRPHRDITITFRETKRIMSSPSPQHRRATTPPIPCSHRTPTAAGVRTYCQRHPVLRATNARLHGCNHKQ